MIFCFKAQALVCLMPSRRPSSTELMPFLAVATSHMARNQLVSGSLVAAGPALALRPGAEPLALGAAAQQADEPARPAQPLDHRPAPLLGAVRLAELRLAQAAHL